MPNAEEERSNVFIVKMSMHIMNEDMTILEKMHIVLSKETREILPPLRELRSIDYWSSLEK